MTKKANVKVIIFTCQECNHEWFSKKEEYVCPECSCVYLDEEKR